MLISAEKTMPTELDNSGWGGRFILLLCIAFFVAGIGSTFLYLEYGYDKNTLPERYQPASFTAWIGQSLLHPDQASQQLKEVKNGVPDIQADLGHRNARYSMPTSANQTDERINYRYFLVSLIILPFVMLLGFLITRWYSGRADLQQRNTIFMHDAWKTACHNLAQPPRPWIQRCSSVPPVYSASFLQSLSPSRLYQGTIGRLSPAREKPPSS